MALKINKQTIDKGTVVDRGIFFEVLQTPAQRQVKMYFSGLASAGASTVFIVQGEGM